MVTPGIAIEQPSRSGLFQRMRRKRKFVIATLGCQRSCPKGGLNDAEIPNFKRLGGMFARTGVRIRFKP
jgi:hypothetical protein